MSSWFRGDNDKRGDDKKTPFGGGVAGAGETPSSETRPYNNVVVSKPVNARDVQTLIDFLKRREPAIVDLDEAGEKEAQRILDFISGAIYALNGTVLRISGNMFLLTPEGVEITVNRGDKTY